MKKNLIFVVIFGFIYIKAWATGIEPNLQSVTQPQLVITQENQLVTQFVTYPQWQKVENGALPKQAISIVNSDNNLLYPCRAHLYNNLIPGQLENGGCLIAYGGRTFIQKAYEVPVINDTQAIVWSVPDNPPQKKNCTNSVSSSGSNNPAPSYLLTNKKGISLAVPLEMPQVGKLNFSKTCTNEPMEPIHAGSENGQTLFICLAVYKRLFHVGKLIGKQCNIGYENEEISLPPYQVFYYIQ